MVVRQSAMLASRYLECGVLDHVIATISNGGKPGRLFQDKKGEKGREIPFSSSESDQHKARFVLSRLADTLTFTLDSTVQDDAVTEVVSDENYRDSEFPHGVQSIIKISTDKYDRLRDAVQAPVRDIPFILYL